MPADSGLFHTRYFILIEIRLQENNEVAGESMATQLEVAEFRSEGGFSTGSRLSSSANSVISGSIDC